MNISALIRELLFSHDCVIVPGFGAFICNYVPAHIERADSTFHPPARKISFNRNLVHNDGLITGRLSELLGINYGDARSMVDEYSAGLRRKLSKGEKIQLDHIGIFTINIEGALQFEPDPESNFCLGSYGLESFRMATLSDYDVRKRVLPGKVPEPVRSSSLRKNLWRAAVIIPVISVLVYVSLRNDIFRPDTGQSSLNPLLREELESNMKALGSEEQTGSDVETAAPEESTPVANVSLPEPEVSIYPGASYSIITGSFRSEDNANAQAEELRQRGFDPEVTEAPNGFYRVSALKCSDIITARNKKDSIGQSYPQSWINKN
ncbi:MAG: SPOR domain-containing protein [Bacteroidales bacterium]|nr:SPOR domain-containing protein [Bacteroidales bacterium]